VVVRLAVRSHVGAHVGLETPLADARAAAAKAPTRTGWIVAGLVLAGLLALLLVQLSPVLAFLLACVVAGFGLTYLAGVDLLFEERLFFGAVIGALVVSGAGFLVFALAAGQLTAGTVWSGALLALAASAPGWFKGRSLVNADLKGARDRWWRHPREPGHPWPLVAVLAISWAYTFRLLSQAWSYGGGGLFAGNPSVWGDWAAHLAYAGSFAYGRNFPPEYPIDPGHALAYPFLVDFFAASLVPLGVGLPATLVLTSGLLGLAFPAVVYLAAVRFLGGRLAAALGFFVFVLMGGLGFVFFFGDVADKGWGVLLHLPREYTHLEALNFVWLNPILASLLPQRSTLFGFSLLFITLTVLYAAKDRPAPDWAPFIAAGVLAGLTPAFHVHAYGTVLALAAFWWVLNRRIEWVGFFLPALLLAAPALAFLWPSSGPGVRLDLGWLATNGSNHDNWAWFWLKNTGLFIPLLLVAQFLRGLLPTDFQRHFAPMWLWFLIPNLVLFHPWDWDNQKFFIFWALLGALLIGALLARLFQGGTLPALLAAGLLFLLVLPGTLDAARDTDMLEASLSFADPNGVEAAAWARSETDPKAIFLAAPDHNEPIPSLAGRRVVIGYPGWVWSYGLTDWGQKEADVAVMLRGDPRTPELIKQYHVAYVVIGPHERTPSWLANQTYWEQHGRLVHSNLEYLIYRVT